MQPRRTTLLTGLLIIIVFIVLLFSVLPYTVAPANTWATTSTQILTLQDLGYTGKGVTIGIIDTGTDIYHPEFDRSSFVKWYDAVNGQPTYYDDEDQGTHLAGILISKGSYEGLFSGIHLSGIAPEATLIITKTIPQNQYLYGGGNDSSIAAGITYCIDNGADIILLSLGMSPEDVDFVQTAQTTQAITTALNQGIFVIAPAGNDRQDDDGDVIFPSSMEQVIAVGSIAEGNVLSSFSSTGHQYPWSINPHKKPELVAPGEHILSTRINGAYGRLSGSSQAATYVTGIFALLLEAYPEYKHDGAKNNNLSTIDLFKTLCAQTAQKIGNLQGTSASYSHDDSYGYGLIQAYDLYKELAKY